MKTSGRFPVSMGMTNPCPQCGRPFASDQAGGLCPACLAGMVAHPTAEPVEELPLAPGQTFRDYEILSLLGRGGMGVVYQARHRHLNHTVALKVLPSKLAADAEFRERFLREARALAALSHPNIVGIHDFGIEGDITFLAMEYVDGVNLREVLRERKLAPPEALKIVPQLCDALEIAHAQGLVHRDIKPENILLDRQGRVKIADFGLAKIVGGAGTRLDTITQPDVVMGTPQYMAPEQLESPRDVDHRADIYSMGVVFYEMLTGELPIGKFSPPSRKVEVDVRLDEVVLKTLEKERECRYQRAGDVKEAVTRITAAGPAPRRGPWGRFLAWTLLCTGLMIAFDIIVSTVRILTQIESYEWEIAADVLWALYALGLGEAGIFLVLAVLLFRRRQVVNTVSSGIVWTGVSSGAALVVTWIMQMLLVRSGNEIPFFRHLVWVMCLAWGAALAAGILCWRLRQTTPALRRLGGVSALLAVLWYALPWGFVLMSPAKPRANAELQYNIFHKPDATALERENAANEVRRGLESRLNTLGTKGVHVELHGDEEVRVQFHAPERNDMRTVRDLCRSQGRFELRIVGSPRLHEQSAQNDERTVPEGYEWLPNPEPTSDSERPFLSSPHVLVRRTPIVTEKNIKIASSAESGYRTSRSWHVNFQLDEAGAEAFDQAASDLFNQVPTGMIAIMIDGRIKSIPVVRSDRFGGFGEIAGGFSEEDARLLAIVLRSGALPVPIGRLEDGQRIEGKPAAQSWTPAE
ncbi:MAG: protein kinase [Planctomycetes bacterium]|nr:protein kinase [Planctomycetota bacterium]